MKNRKIALLGCGNLGRIIMTNILNGTVVGYEPVAVMDINEAARNAMAEFVGCTACASLEEVLACKPDIIVEATAPNPLKALALPVLKAGVDLVSLSVGDYAEIDYDGGVCFIHKKAVANGAYSDSENERFFTDFSSDAADYLYSQALAASADKVKIKDALLAIDIISIPYNSYYRTDY